MITHRKLVLNTKTELQTIEWLKFNDYIHSTMFCEACHLNMNFIANDRLKSFRCPKCRTEKSLFSGTIFFNSHLKLNLSLDLIYFWTLDSLQEHVKRELETKSNQTVNSWYRKLQHLSYGIMRQETRNKIGGEGHIVQIDECLFSKSKYNIGRVVRKVWVVGGIDYITNECFLVETFFRSAAQLEAIILANVEIGTTVYTDEWAGYNNLNALGFLHDTVNHTTNFINHTTGANTQKIEGTWSVAKRWLRKKSITNRCDLFLYFTEFCFKRKYRVVCFEKIMCQVKNFEYLTLN